MRITESKIYYLFVSFIVGGCTMALELCASRLLAPHFGTSIIIWTNVIAVVLLSLSLGYYVGGRIAEKECNPHYLGGILFVGSMFILCIPILSPPLLKGNFGFSGGYALLGLVVGSFVSSIALFGVPVFLLGTVSPYLLTLVTKKFGHIGNTAGQLFALSTIGGLLGTFLPTLLFIPWLGTKVTITICGLLLGILSLLLLPKYRPHALLILVALTLLQLLFHDKYPYQIAALETTYQRVSITSPKDDIRYLQIDAGFGVQSMYNPNSLLTGYYFDYANILPGLVKAISQSSIKPIRMLIIGVAGGTIPRQLNHFYGNSVELHAIELDKGVIQLAKEHMDFAHVPIHITYGDGRSVLSHSNELYDVIYVDAYANDLQIPWTMTTQEFWKEIRNHVSPHGIAAMNIAAIGASDSTLTHVLTNTQATVFPYVYDAKLTEGDNANHLVTLSSHEITDNLILTPYIPESLQLLAQKWQSNITRVSYSPTVRVLTDDKTPVEWLMAKDMIHYSN